MKTRLFALAGLGAVALFFSSCAHSPYHSSAYTKEGAVLGSLLGAAAGGIIGHQSGRGLEGAAIGAGAGALAGGIYGSAQDERYGRYSHYRPSAPRYQEPYYRGSAYRHPSSVSVEYYERPGYYYPHRRYSHRPGYHCW